MKHCSKNRKVICVCQPVQVKQLFCWINTKRLNLEGFSSYLGLIINGSIAYAYRHKFLVHQNYKIKVKLHMKNACLLDYPKKL